MGRWELQRHGFDKTTHTIREVNQTSVIGRRDTDIVCQSTTVSRRHCTIAFRDNLFYLSDLKSLNGTFLNGARVNPEQPRELRDGDIIGLGISSDEEGEREGGEYFVFTFRKHVNKAPVPKLPKPASSTSTNSTSSVPGVAVIDLTNSNTSESESQEHPREPQKPETNKHPKSRGTASEESEEPGPSAWSPQKKQAKEQTDNHQKQMGRKVKVEPESDSSSKVPAEEQAESSSDASEEAGSFSDESSNSGEVDQLKLGSKYPRRKMKEARKKEEKRMSQLRQLEEERERKRALEMNRTEQSPNKQKQTKNKQLSEGGPGHESTSESDQRVDTRGKKRERQKSPKQRPSKKKQSSSSSPDGRKHNGRKQDKEEKSSRHQRADRDSRRAVTVESDSEGSDDRRADLERSQEDEEAKALSQQALERKAVIILERVDQVGGLSQSPLKPTLQSPSRTTWQHMTKDRTERSEGPPKVLKKRNRQPTDSDEEESPPEGGKKKRTNEPPQNRLPTRSSPGPCSSSRRAAPERGDCEPSSAGKKLEIAKEKIHNRQPAPRRIKILDVAPAIKSRPWPNRAQEPSAGFAGRDINKFVEPEAVSTPTKKDIKEKLAELARKKASNKETLEGHLPKRPAAPSIAKLTTRNRQDILTDSLVGPTLGRVNPGPSRPQPIAIVPDNTATASTVHLPLPSVEPILAAPKPTTKARQDEKKTQSRSTEPWPSSARVLEEPAVLSEMPLARIQKEMDKKKNQRLAAPAPLVPELQVKTRPTTFTGSGVLDSAPSTLKSCSSVTKKVGEDRVYRDILLHWRTGWLQGEGGRGSPPVHGNAELITCLPHYRDFQVYFDTFHPLMLHELWASISQDFQREARRNGNHIHRGQGTCDFQVGIRLIQDAEQCPLTASSSKSKQTDAFWHIVHLHCTAPKRGAFNRDFDFGKFSYDVKTLVGVERREVFFFVRPGSEKYDEVSNGGKGVKYSLQIVTHLAQRGAVLQENTARVEKMAYVYPKIRDLHCLAQLPSSSLSSLILNPIFPADVFDPNRSVSPADLVSSVHTMLNPIQRGVVHHIASRVLGSQDPDLFLLHGPPGTGKTRTIVGLVLQLLRGSRRRLGRVLVCTPSNTALDELIRRLAAADEGLRLVRLGQSCSPDVKKHSLEELIKTHCGKLSHSEMISEAISSFSREIEALERELETRAKELDPAVVEAKLAAIMSLKQKRQQHTADLDNMKKSPRNVGDARRQMLGCAQVVFSTLNSCNSSVRKELLALDKKSEPFGCCIIDEATQTTEVESLSPLISMRCTKLVLVGDPHQLPATILSSEAESRGLGTSLFSRLFRFFESRKTGSLKSPVMLLTQQYRMHPSILRWPNQRFYENKLLTHNSVLSDPRRKLLLRPFVFLNIKGQESKMTRQISNVGEVSLVREILTILQKLRRQSQNHMGLSIGIISPYNEQKAKLRELLRQLKQSEVGEDEGFADSVEIDTVDSFQGREKHIVLLSCVRTEDMGFLRSPERLNVALTRAKMALIIIGDAECLNKNEMWKSLMDDAVTNGAFSHIPADYRDKGAEYLTRQLEARLVLSPAKSRK